MRAVLLGLGAAIIAALASFVYLTHMPGRSADPPAVASSRITETAERLRRSVEVVATDIGGRSAGACYRNLQEAANYLDRRLSDVGYSPQRQRYEAEGLTFENIEAQLTGNERPEGIIVIGAHYDTAGGLPGANDNGSGVAAVLELAERLAGRPRRKTIRWVFFANEEPPWFQTPAMGSYVYARRCKERGEKVEAMLSLETIGYYSSQPGSQKYPVGFHPGYPDRGDFLGFVSDVRSVRLLRRVAGTFRKATPLPAEGAAAPSSIPGVGWSDHWAFWQFGYRAVMVTDTAPYRYPWYHTAQDTPEKLDYERMAQAVDGLAAVARDLADH